MLVRSAVEPRSSAREPKRGRQRPSRTPQALRRSAAPHLGQSRGEDGGEGGGEVEVRTREDWRVLAATHG